MDTDEQVLAEIHAMIGQLSVEEQEALYEFAHIFRFIVENGGPLSKLALALVGAELGLEFIQEQNEQRTRGGVAG